MTSAGVLEHGDSIVVPDGGREFHTYSVYGVLIQSEIPLSFPETLAQRVPDVTFYSAPHDWFVRVAADFPSEDKTLRWYERACFRDGSELIRWPAWFEFVVSPDGRSVVCGLFENATTESFETYLLGQALSFALIKQGYEPLHATAVVLDGKGVGLIGGCGAGKSTLAAAFLHAGHRLLTDDLLLIRDVDGTLTGFPGPPRIKLFPQAARRFLPESAANPSMNPDTEKVIVPLQAHQVHDRPVPMHGFVRLDEGATEASGLRTTPLAAAEALLELVRSTFNGHVVSSDRMRRQFQAVQDWTVRLSVRSLRYPRTWPTLEPVRQAITAEVRSAQVKSA